MIYFSLFFYLLFLFAGCTPDTKQQLKGFSKYLEDIGFSFYNPPRTDRGPASVFRFVKAESGKTIVSPVCKKLFEHVPENESQLSIPSKQSEDQVTLAFALSLIKDLLSAPPKLEAAWDSNSLINVWFSDVNSEYINEEDLYNEKGIARSITPSCFSALKRLSEQGDLKENVFIVQESVRVGSMLYDAKNSYFGKADAQANIKGVVNFKPGIKYDFKDNTKLEINESRYVAFRAFLLKDYVHTGLTSVGSAIVKAEPMNLSDINKRLKE